MVLIQKKCEMILSDFKDAVCRNPNIEIDFTPYVKRFTAGFSRLEKMYEKRIINTLFLNLYGLDAASLRRDLCHFEAPVKAVNTHPLRVELLRSLYGVLCVYAENKSPSTIAEYKQQQDDSANEVKRKEYGKILSQVREDARRNQNIDFTPYIQELMFAAEFKKLEKECENKVISTLLLNLYEKDTRALDRDMAKVGLLGMGSVAPSERESLLQCLYGTLSSYIQEDFSWIIAMCDKVEALEQ